MILAAVAMLWQDSGVDVLLQQPETNPSIFFSLKDSNLGVHSLLLTFFDNINF